MTCLIGITCGWQEQEARHIVNDSYVLAVKKAGGIPLLIPALDESQAEDVYNSIDGIIFTGGDDPDPFFYGEEPEEGLGDVTPRRDSFELALARCALKGEKPVLGICRGIQLLNIAAGGTLYQDLKGHTRQQHRQIAPRWHTSHRVEIEKQSRLYQTIKNESVRVNSFHHQAVREVGKGLWVVARSLDGMIEAIEAVDPQKYLLGLQWHPELLIDRDEHSFHVFAELIELAR